MLITRISLLKQHAKMNSKKIMKREEAKNYDQVITESLLMAEKAFWTVKAL